MDTSKIFNKCEVNSGSKIRVKTLVLLVSRVQVPNNELT